LYSGMITAYFGSIFYLMLKTLVLSKLLVFYF